jgi:hypothetical protein
MFHFPTLASHTYGFSMRSFGNPGINARLTAPPGFSQPSTPFIAFQRQDIPRTPLVTWPRRFMPHEHTADAAQDSPWPWRMAPRGLRQPVAVAPQYGKKSTRTKTCSRQPKPPPAFSSKTKMPLRNDQIVKDLATLRSLESSGLWRHQKGAFGRD